MFSLQGKNALIMCGSQGTGLQAAHALGKAGARVMLAGKNADELENAVQELQDLGIDARWVQVDNRQQPEWQRAVTQTLERMGDIHILVNHLACLRPNGSEQMEVALNASQYVVTHSMLASRQGAIINLVDVCVRCGSCETPNQLASNAVHQAAIKLTRAMAERWRRHGIRVNAIGVCASAGASLLANGVQGAVVLFASAAGQQITGQWLTVTCCEDAHNGD